MAPMCTCGCGEQTRGGKFRPGHDARYCAQLRSLYRRGGRSRLKAERLAAEQGWDLGFHPMSVLTNSVTVAS